jgi:transcriptional regulator with XRE-family HTH domain
MEEKYIVSKSKLRNEREEREWTRNYVADELKVSPYTVGQWERGKNRPHPYHIDKLCELYGKTADELGLIRERDEAPLCDSGKMDEVIEKTTVESAPVQHLLEVFQAFQRYVSYHMRVSILISLVLVLVLGYSLSALHLRTTVEVQPGGWWISPGIGQSVKKTVHFAAHAYPTYPKEDPAISFVKFTAFWPGADPNNNNSWITACVVYPPKVGDIFTCNVDLTLLGAKADQIQISFDVYDQKGHVRLAPNGERTISYTP